MAVIENCPAVKAEIVVQHRPLREYDDDGEEGSPDVTTKYIEAQSGAEFALKWTFTEPFQQEYGVRIEIKIDGSKTNSRVYEPSALFRRGGHLKQGVGVKKDGKWYRRNYQFTALNIVEDIADSSKVPALRRDVEMTGCISLEFYYIENMHRDTRPAKGYSQDGLTSLGDLPEKALKGDARSHQTTLGELYGIKPRTPGFLYDWVSGNPFATFHFKYRSRAALKALRIIPDEDAEHAPPQQRPEDQMTPTELREELRRVRANAAEERRVKQEGAGEGRVKRERSPDAANDGDDNDDDDEIKIVETRQKRPKVDPEVIVLDE